MSWQEVLCSIGINVFSSFLFVGILYLCLRITYLNELSEAKQFFGFGRKNHVRIYLSAHEDKQTASKSVVTALEYEAAAELKNTLQELSGRKFISIIAGLVGLDLKLPEPIIDMSPLGVVREIPSHDSLILIGGPLRNQVTRFYAEKEPHLKYDTEINKYLERKESGYQPIEEPDIVAVLVKMIVDEQTVIFAFGNGEVHTKSVVLYLIENWRKLNKERPHQSFGICISIDQNGRVKCQKIIPER